MASSAGPQVIVPPLSITASATELKVSPGASAAVVFTVANRGAQPVTVVGQPKPLGATGESWLSLDPHQARADVGGEVTFTLTIQVPAATRGGSYYVRVDAWTEADPDETAIEGPVVRVEVLLARAVSHWKLWAAIAGGVVVLLLIGGGVAAFIFLPQSAAANPKSLDFRSTRVGSTSATQQVAITNSGHRDIHIASAGFAARSGFVVTGNDCKNRTLPAGGQCHITLAFVPHDAGPVTDRLDVLGDGSKQPLTSVQLKGSGQALPVVRVDPAVLVLQAPHFIAVTRVVTVTNQGPGDAHVTAVDLRSNVNTFHTKTDCIGQTLASGKTCEIDVTFVSAQSGVFPGALTVISDGASSPQAVTLQGQAF
ncbi:MAG: choice-of-anchor D domain-containing protein [Chloroflexota bacterium]